MLRTVKANLSSWMVLVSAFVLFVFPSSASVASDVHTTHLNLLGNVNAEIISASGICTYDYSTVPGPITNDITYLGVPSSWHCFLGTITIINTWKCPSSTPAVMNIDEATCGEYYMSRTVIIKDSGGDSLGAVEITGNVWTLDADSSRAELNVVGSYDGPVDMFSFDGYAMFLEQEAPGRIRGSFEQAVYGYSDTMTLSVTTIWEYACAETLPEPEYSFLAIDSVDFDGQRLYFTGSGYYQLQSRIPTLTEWGLIIFGVMLLGFITWVFLRRRRVAAVRVG